MQDIQQVFNELQGVKKELKDIKKEYRDALTNANEYEETVAEATKLREKKKKIENITQQRMGKRYERLEELKQKSSELAELMTDIAMSTLMSGKSIDIKDEYENPYEPIYKISFKKVG